MNIKQVIADRPWILAICVSLLVVLWMWSGTLNDEAPTTSGNVIAGGQSDSSLTRVQVRTQVAEPIVRYISVNGRTAPARIVALNAETDGRVTTIEAERGERLKQGEMILRLDLRDRQARLEQARASVREHETRYQAQLKLKSEGYVSDTQIAETLAQLEGARAELKRAELDLQYMLIRAPFDGVLQERDVEVGDFVRAGDPVATYVDNTQIIVTGTIAEQDARFARVGDVATAVLITGQTVEGLIRYVSPVADESTRTFTVELEIPNPDGALPAGVTAEMRVPGGKSLAQKISPSILTLDADGNVGVKVIDEYNRAVFYIVQIAQSEPDGVWGTGLPETANIIVVGQGFVAIGQEVEPVFAESDTALAAEQVSDQPQ